MSHLMGYIAVYYHVLLLSGNIHRLKQKSMWNMAFWNMHCTAVPTVTHYITSD